MAKIKKKAQRPKIAPGEEFKTIAGTAADYYQRYAKQFNTFLTVAAIALLAVVLLSVVNAGKERKAGEILDAAYAYYAPSGEAKGDLQRALDGFGEVVKQYGGTLNGAIAQYFAGNALAEMGRYEEALKAYDEVLKRHGGKKTLAGLVHTRKGYAYEALGRQEEAQRSFEAAEAAGGPGPATLELARLFEREGKPDDAQRKYKELTEKLPATSLAMEARSKLPPPNLEQQSGGKGEQIGQ